MKEFDCIEEMRKYFNSYNNTYEFIEDYEVEAFDIKLNFDFNFDANIKEGDIEARNIDAFSINVNDLKVTDLRANDIIAHDIKARDIKARDIKANNIEYYAFCIAYMF